MTAADARGPRFLPAMLVLFVGSGCAALIYEIVWFQMLQLVIGASGVSLGVLLGTFMGGMFLGSLALPRFVPFARHPLRVYAVLELGIGLLALLLLVLLPRVSGAYTTLLPTGLPSTLLRAVLAAFFLLPPTLLMGATLPAISRYVQTTPRGVSWMGFFYGGNIAGAVLGATLAGFYLLRVHDLVTATLVGVGVNLAVAGAALLLARSGGPRVADPGADSVEPVFSRGRRVIYIAIGLSGLTALGAEVVWTRLMSLLLGATTYTFSIILAVFLTGLGLGSGAGSALARTVRDPRRALGVCQLLLVPALAWTAYWVSAALPYWPVNPSITSSPWFLFQIDVARAALALLPAPLLWGASFPLAVAAAAHPGQDGGRLVGGIYAANTLGAIVGALAFALLFIPWLGTQNAQRLLVVFAAGSGMLVLAPSVLRIRNLAWTVPALVGGALLVVSVAPVPPVLVAYGRYAPTYPPPYTLYVGEGMNSSVAVTELTNGVRNLHIGGKVVASTEPQDMRLQRMLGHITALLHPEPRSVLVVGFGAGVTAGSFLTHPGIERVVIAEIEPLVTEVAARYFTEANFDVLNDPRVEVVHDDARHYLLTTDETFDLITADPIHPWMKGAAALYTQEYFELTRAHLNPGGVITQWVPLYESTAEVVRSELATFFAAFPEGSVWGNHEGGLGYDVVLAAAPDGLSVDVDDFVRRLARGDHLAVARSLSEVGLPTALDLLGTYAGYAADLTPWTEGADINRDRNLRLMYLAGLGLNRYEQASIYNQILSYRRFPSPLFGGSPEAVQALGRWMGLLVP